MKTTIYTLIVGLMAIVMVGMYCERQSKPPERPLSRLTTPERVIMSIRELQQALNDKAHPRYKCEVDGQMGQETLKAWDNFICDRQATKEFKQ